MAVVGVCNVPDVLEACNECASQLPMASKLDQIYRVGYHDSLLDNLWGCDTARLIGFCDSSVFWMEERIIF